MKIRTYHEMLLFSTFEERFEYLKVGSQVGSATFGYERHLNQAFYRSAEWKRIRHQVITRDMGRDLGLEGYEIYDKVLIHHMNPITPDDIYHRNLDILDPKYLISVSHKTHNAIHYGDISSLPRLVERSPGDTTLW